MFHTKTNKKMKIQAITDNEKKILISVLNQRLEEMKKEKSKYSVMVLRLFYDIQIRDVEMLIRDILTHENEL